MKKSKLITTLLSTSLVLTACNKAYDVYYADVPLDLVYSGTLTDILITQSNKDKTKSDKTTMTYAVAQKYENILGEEKFVTYVEWRMIGEWYGWDLVDNSYTYLNIGDTTLVLNEAGNAWVKEEDRTIYTYTYKTVYVAYDRSDSFRYKLTAPVFLRNGGSIRELPQKYKTKVTDEYIEYVCKDDETFHISNNKYNVVLKYYYDTKLGSINDQEATFNVGDTKVPHLNNDGSVGGPTTEHVPYLNTITPELFEK